VSSTSTTIRAAVDLLGADRAMARQRLPDRRQRSDEDEQHAVAAGNRARLLGVG
jgi:hypothetical protein